MQIESSEGEGCRPGRSVELRAEEQTARSEAGERQK